jgi:hypothetical protein
VSGWYSTNILGNRDGEVLDLVLFMDFAARAQLATRSWCVRDQAPPWLS